ncbi:uncharacterized protein VTP21DRAFT_9683 [Calcarisporiella thermophila]|uniref:uncharacterized protein n=1 Tax=Calcarisporiella thermophila TaxID=911321 RepID=UPI003743295E
MNLTNLTGLTTLPSSLKDLSTLVSLFLSLCPAKQILFFFRFLYFWSSFSLQPRGRANQRPKRLDDKPKMGVLPPFTGPLSTQHVAPCQS